MHPVYIREPEYQIWSSIFREINLLFKPFSAKFLEMLLVSECCVHEEQGGTVEAIKKSFQLTIGTVKSSFETS